jgi:hypothetical protein
LTITIALQASQNDEQPRFPAHRRRRLGLRFGDKLWAQYAAMPASRLAEDEGFWAAIRGKYRLTPDYINPENGYYSMQSQPVLEALIARVREVNYQASAYMRGPRVPDKAAARDKLAALGGCEPGGRTFPARANAFVLYIAMSFKP